MHTSEVTKPAVLSASTVIGDEVVNPRGESLGKIEEVMLDMEGDRIAYAVLSFGGLFGIGDKLFAVPWDALELDPENKRFVLDVPREKLEEAPGFDKSDWPDFADRSFGTRVHDYYGTAPYWTP
jgi:sporulation protein YlmC with PRC-barrel domain